MAYKMRMAYFFWQGLFRAYAVSACMPEIHVRHFQAAMSHKEGAFHRAVSPQYESDCHALRQEMERLRELMKLAAQVCFLALVLSGPVLVRVDPALVLFPFQSFIFSSCHESVSSWRKLD